MAIYHLSAQVISRAKGRSAVAASAYRSASRMVEQSTGLTHDYSRKQKVVARGILTPEHAPMWMQTRTSLWNGVEAREVRKDAQLAREICVALPVELPLAEQRVLLRGYIQEQFVSQGMVADYAIHHDNPANPHAHVMLTMRVIEGDGFGLKNTAWNAKERLLHWRQAWAETSNHALALAGHDRSIDARSYAEQGIPLIPGIKIGAGFHQRSVDGRDIVAERLARQQAILEANGRAILQDPSLATEAITRQQATFTRSEVKRWLKGHTANEAQQQACLDAVLAQPSLVRLANTDRGQKRWTTTEMLRCEKQLMAHAAALAEAPRALNPLGAADGAQAGTPLNGEQRRALDHLLASGGIAVVEGYAGSGKSTLLGTAKRAWEAQGYKVEGVAIAGVAAEGLEVSSGISSRTLASWEYRLANGHALGERDVLVIDEAGMVGTRQLERVLQASRTAGSKVVLVGDTAQLQAIEAGSPMRAIGRLVGSASLENVRRQDVAWQRQASLALAKGKTRQALDAYEKHGHLHAHETQDEAIAGVLRSWNAHRQKKPNESQVMLAYTRQDVRRLNEAARALRQEKGELGKIRTVQTERGLRDFSENDRIVFLRNDRHLGVKNGTLGTLERSQGHHLQVCLDGPKQKRVAVDMRAYRHLDHGYATTVHKSQGITAERTQVLVSPHFDRHATYVALSRHKQQLDVHWSREAFGSRKRLVQRLSQSRFKAMALDSKNQKTKTTDREKGKPNNRTDLVSSRSTVSTRRPAQAPISLAKAMARVSEVKEAQRQVDTSTKNYHYYNDAYSAFKKNHPIRSRFPMQAPWQVERSTGKTMRLDKCVEYARQDLEEKTINLDQLKKSQAIVATSKQIQYQESKKKLIRETSLSGTRGESSLSKRKKERDEKGIEIEEKQGHEL